MNNHLRTFVRKHLSLIRALRNSFTYFKYHFLNPTKLNQYGSIGDHTIVETPVFFTNQNNVFLEDFSKIRFGFTLINYTGKFIIKKYSAVAPECIVVTGNHAKTVGVPQIIGGSHHINDIERDIVIENDVWVGVRVTLLSGAKIGRGSVVAAGAVVNKEIPPYAVVAGVPAKIIATSYSIEQIIEHERVLYSENERFSRDELEAIFAEHYVGKKSIGRDSDIGVAAVCKDIAEQMNLKFQ